MKTMRYGHADMISYDFNIVEKVVLQEPMNYLEAYRSKEEDLWHKAMKEEIASLKKTIPGFWLTNQKTRS